MSRAVRRAGLVAGAVVAVAVIVAVAGYLWMRTALPSHEGDVALPGLADTVEVGRDSLGIPHVRAPSAEAASFAQGYLHASDRLWQMEMFRRVAWGRLSELFGEGALESDRFLRTLGMHRAAARELATLEPGVLRLLEAYADGVNAYLETRDGALPPEFVLLRARPEAWRPVHTVALEKIMAWDLAEYRIGLALAVAREELDDDELRVIWPGYPEWGPTILPESVPGRGGGRAGSDADADGTRAARRIPRIDAALAASARVPDGARTFLEAVSAARASNAWVVGPDRSRSGRPLLANDMHLGLDAPNIWYLMALHAPGLDVAGMTLPGSPLVIAGHNRAVAWGLSNAYVDDVDFFVERLAPGDSTRYRTPGGTEPFRRRVEEIRVRGRDEPVRHVVRETRHGPVMTPVVRGPDDELLALRWTAHDPGGTVGAVMAMNRAASAEELAEALRGFDSPNQNVVFADTAGSFGYRMAGRVPLRGGRRPPLLPVPGWTGAHDWTGELPFDEHPHAMNPASGYVVTANNRQSPDSIGGLVNRRWAPPFRASRIREMLEAAPRHGPGDFRRMQLDVRSAFARRYREAAVDAFREADLPATAEALAAWDLRSDTGSVDATVYYAWIGGIRRLGRRWLYGGDRGYFPLRGVRHLVEARPPGYDTLAVRAALDASEAAVGVRWGEAHRLVLDHPLAALPVAGALLGFRLGPFPREGAHYTVNPAGFPGTRPPFTVTSGASQRHVVDLADVDGAGGFVIPGGESGIPFSPHYDDQLPLYRAGRLWRIPLAEEAAGPRLVRRARLVPPTRRP